MLTKDDLIAIGQIIDQRIDKKIEPIINNKLDPITKDIKNIKTDVTKIQKDVRVMLAFLDREDVKLRKRIERIEEHLGLPSLD